MLHHVPTGLYESITAVESTRAAIEKVPCSVSWGGTVIRRA